MLLSSDGLRVNRPCQYVVIRDCIAGSGGGMFTCGSETSGGIRVPFIVNQPGKVPVQTLNNIIYFPDVMPTLTTVANAMNKLPQTLNGINIFPLFYGKQMNTDNLCYIENFPASNVQHVRVIGKWLLLTKTLLWNCII